MPSNHSRRGFLAAGCIAIATAAASTGWARQALKSKIGRIGLGFSLYGMKSLPVGKAISECAKLGYESVELALMPGFHADPAKVSAEDRKRLRESLAENRIRVAALMENLPLLVEEKMHHVNLERLKLAFELAADLVPERPPLVETVLGGKPAEWEASRDRLAERLAVWEKLAAKAKVVLAIKGHVSNAAHLPEHVVWLVEKVGSPWLKAAYDYSHFELRRLGLAETLKTLLPHTAFIHLKDVRGEPSKFQFLLPGEGKTDYGAYFKLLGDMGYAGDVVVEVSGQIHSQPDYDPLLAARRCYEHLAPALAKAAV